jgi:hypothetical protein
MDEIAPPHPAPPRRLPGLPMPAYRYIPGFQPHPYRAEGGHQHLAGQHPSGETCWLHGLDLFDHRYVWESHEVWEPLWLALRAGSAEKELVQAMIQWAASLLKGHMGAPEAALRLLGRAQARVAVARQAGPVCQGLDLDALLAPMATPGWPPPLGGLSR